MSVEEVKKEMDKAEIIVVFLTKSYVSKCTTEGSKGGNIIDTDHHQCVVEYNHAMKTKGAARTLVVVLDPEVIDVKQWGILYKPLGSKLFLSMKTTEKVVENFYILCQLINEMGIQTKESYFHSVSTAAAAASATVATQPSPEFVTSIKWQKRSLRCDKQDVSDLEPLLKVMSLIYIYIYI